VTRHTAIGFYSCGLDLRYFSLCIIAILSTFRNFLVSCDFSDWNLHLLVVYIFSGHCLGTAKFKGKCLPKCREGSDREWNVLRSPSPWHFAQLWQQGCQRYAGGAVHPQGISLGMFSVRGWVHLKTIQFEHTRLTWNFSTAPQRTASPSAPVKIGVGLCIAVPQELLCWLYIFAMFCPWEWHIRVETCNSVYIFICVTNLYHRLLLLDHILTVLSTYDITTAYRRSGTYIDSFYWIVTFNSASSFWYHLLLVIDKQMTAVHLVDWYWQQITEALTQICPLPLNHHNY
jgi:hypothetical protein